MGSRAMFGYPHAAQVALSNVGSTPPISSVGLSPYAGDVRGPFHMQGTTSSPEPSPLQPSVRAQADGSLWKALTLGSPLQVVPHQQLTPVPVALSD